MISRREFVVSATGVVVAAGCRKQASERVASKPPRRDVPLRVVLVGSDEEAEILTRGWSSIMSQPLKIETVQIPRSAAGELSQLPELAKKSDVLIYPLIAVADLFATQSLVAITDEEFEAGEQELGQTCPAVKNGAAKYGGQVVALPLGTALPALVTVDELDPLADWAEYDRWVAGLDGAVSEPLAPGWAGAMFLWRAANALETGWLFAREDMTPLLDSQPYVDILTQMKTTAARYQLGRQSPTEIWKQIQAGKLRGGICVPGSSDEMQLNIADLPGTAEGTRVLLDPFSPVVSISATCRQTAASKEFANWLSGGDGSETVRRQIPGMTLTREAAALSDQQQALGYTRWLQERLQVPVTFPSLQLLSGGEYYSALDQQIGRCLEDEVAAVEALAAAATTWSKLNRKVGVEKQARAWRRAQGMRA